MQHPSSDNGSKVSLRDYVEGRLTDQLGEIKALHAALKELLLNKLDEKDKALKLQAEEYSRRLSDLNHEHTKNIERNAEFVGKEKFESFEREFRQYKDTNDKAVAEKAKSIADAVEQKATAATNAVDSKAIALKNEFDQYKMTQATAMNLAAGSKQGMSRIGAIAIGAISVIATVLWGASMALNIYMSMHMGK